MYYIEFFEKRAEVSQQQFRDVVRRSTEEWWRDHPEDELVLQIGRTWRMGPRPTYMTIWKIASFARFDAWKSEFQKADVIEHHRRFSDVATIVDAGAYEDLGGEIL